MPSAVVRRNLKSKQATARKRATSRNKVAVQKRRVIARKKAVGKSSTRSQKSRMTPAMKVASGIAALVMSASALKGAGHPSPPPNQGVRANVKGSKVSVYTQQKFGSRGVFSSWRFSQKTTTNGPVVFVEQSIPNKGKPDYLQVGIAQKVNLPASTVARLGFRSSELGKGRLDWKKSTYGVILVRKGVSVEADRWGSKEKNRYAVKAPVLKSSIDVSHMEAGFLSPEKSTRVGIGKLEKTLGVNLGKLATSMGITFPKGRSGKVDVGVFYPKGNKAVGVNVFEMPDREYRISGCVIVTF